MLLPEQLQQLDRAAESAVACERATELPAELTVAQWVLESGWGTHQPGNNCFGIKAYEGCYGVQMLPTVEVVDGLRTPVMEKFATFPTLDACFGKHASLITSAKPYAQAWAQYRTTHDLDAFICHVAQVYATDPNYCSLVLRILAMPEVQSAIRRARGGGSPDQSNET